MTKSKCEVVIKFRFIREEIIKLLQVAIPTTSRFFTFDCQLYLLRVNSDTILFCLDLNICHSHSTFGNLSRVTITHSLLSSKITIHTFLIRHKRSCNANQITQLKKLT